MSVSRERLKSEINEHGITLVVDLFLQMFATTDSFLPLNIEQVEALNCWPQSWAGFYVAVFSRAETK